jgi:arabinofuranosyltransferase
MFDTHFLKQSVIRRHGWFVLGLLYFLFIFFKNAWVADDAYISFRSVEQLFAGHGPRWNIDERVQVYTSPLWFMLLCLARVFTSDLFIASVLLSALCCVGCLWVARQAIRNDRQWFLFVLVASGAWAVMDFTSSGLENPLLYLLISCYLWSVKLFLEQESLVDKKKAFSGLLGSLGLLAIARHDMATLVLIPSVYLLYRGWKVFGIHFLLKQSYLVWAPLLIWTIFSVVYYGVPFPNTAYAKMLHGISRHELVDFGKLYLLVSMRWDYFVQIAFAGLFVSLLWKRSLLLLCLVAGVGLNLFYVVYVGGDFMQGRFISVPVLFSALAASMFIRLPDRVSTSLLVLLVVLVMYWHVPLKQPAEDGFDLNQGKRHYSWHGILNERNFYFKTNSLWAWWHRNPDKVFPDHKWCAMGKRASERNKEAADFGGIGMYGYCAGLQLIVIDRLALGEPFLARLPKPPTREWRAGHFHRDYPRGYYESRISGENHLLSPRLAELWDDVVLLTRAPLFTAERWRAIWRINSGYYSDIGPDYLADIGIRNK